MGQGYPPPNGAPALFDQPIFGGWQAYFLKTSPGRQGEFWNLKVVFLGRRGGRANLWISWNRETGTFPLKRHDPNHLKYQIPNGEAILQAIGEACRLRAIME